VLELSNGRIDARGRKGTDRIEAIRSIRSVFLASPVIPSSKYRVLGCRIFDFRPIARTYDYGREKYLCVSVVQILLLDTLGWFSSSRSLRVLLAKRKP
jgi:hypothetical protein